MSDAWEAGMEEKEMAAAERVSAERSMSAMLRIPSRISWRATARPIPEAAPGLCEHHELLFMRISSRQHELRWKVTIQ